MIELLDIDFHFGQTLALQNINLRIRDGERVVLLGPNGSGKSTLLKILAGLYFPEKGKYFYNGVEIGRKAFRDKNFEKFFRKNVQIMFQEPDIMLFNPTVYEELAFGPILFGMDNVDEKVKVVAERLGIVGLLKRPVYLLSGGEKAKVALASVLILEPSLLLLDEPTAYLDTKTTKKLCRLLKDRDFTTIVAMHDIHIARYFGERFVVISEEHKIIFDGSFDALVESGFVEQYRFSESEKTGCKKEGGYAGCKKEEGYKGG